MSNREALINSLAEAMGASTPSATLYSDSKYDRETGTFYCNGHIITSNTIDKAIIYYQNLYQRAIKNPDNKEVAMIYELASEAIRLLRKDPNMLNKMNGGVKL